MVTWVFICSNLVQDGQLQQIVDKTIMEADKDGDGKLSFEEFASMVANTVSLFLCIYGEYMLIIYEGYRETDDAGGLVLRCICSYIIVITKGVLGCLGQRSSVGIR